MTKLIAAAIAFAAMSTAAFASQSFDASKTACADLQTALQKDGSISIRTLFGDRDYVASPSSCEAFQAAIPAYEASSDSLLCHVGYICQAENLGAR
jgi:hypothetical protein